MIDDARTDIYRETLQEIADKGTTTFADPRKGRVCWQAVENGLLPRPKELFRDAEEVTAATTASARGAYLWGPLTERGKQFLSRIPPTPPTFTEEDSPERQAARDAAIERARKIADES